MSTLPEETAVLVVGAGPTGLSLAIALRRLGVDCVVVDKLAEPLPWSRALGLHARTLEIFDALGVLEAIRERSLTQKAVAVHNERGLIFELDLTQLDAPFPWVLSCPQADVEACLTARLEALGGRVVRGTGLSEFQQDAEGVVARLHDGRGWRELRCRLLAGCDGAHSLVREQLGLRFDGVRYADHFLLTDLDIDWDLARDSSHGFLLPEGALIALPMPEGWRLVINQRESEVAQDSEPDLMPFRQRLKSALGEEPPLGEPRWLSRFSIHRRLASHYRRNRVLLAGDACHVQSPLGAQGMNTGIADAFNLGWKMGLFLQGIGGGTLLDSYERERRLVARNMLNAVDVLSRTSFTRNRLLRGGRDAFLRLAGGHERVGRRLVRRASQLDVNYRHALGLMEAAPGFHKGPGPHPGDRVPDARLVHTDGSHSQRLQALLRDPRHQLVVWLPDAGAHRSVVTAFALADRVWSEYGDLLAMTVVTPSPVDPRLSDLRDFSVPLLVDRDGEFRQRFGGDNSLWLIRPDGHLAWRGRARDADHLIIWLERFFQRRQPASISNGSSQVPSPPRSSR